MKVLAVTGTDTEVGKTVVTAAIAAMQLSLGRTVAVVKPAQTGIGPEEDGDLAEVRRLAGEVSTYEGVRLPDPLAPDTAARVGGLPLPSLAEQRDLVATVANGHDVDPRRGFRRTAGAARRGLHAARPPGAVRRRVGRRRPGRPRHPQPRRAHRQARCATRGPTSAGSWSVPGPSTPAWPSSRTWSTSRASRACHCSVVSRRTRRGCRCVSSGATPSTGSRSSRDPATAGRSLLRLAAW